MTTQNQIQKTPKFRFGEIGYVRSYMVDNIEVKEVLHIDRVDNPWARNIITVLEKLAVGVPDVATLIIGNDFVTLKLDERWKKKVRFNRDGAVVISVYDCALVADDKFLLLCVDEDGYYTPIAKSETITWDGTEEYFSPSDVRHLVKDALRRVLQLARWL